MFLSTCSCFTTGKDAKKLVIVVWKNVSPIDFLPVHILQVSFRHCRPLAASRFARSKDMQVLHKCAQPYMIHMPIFWCLVDPPKTCSCVFSSNRVTFWHVSFGMLRTVSQVSLTGFTTYRLVKAPVKLTNSTIFAGENLKHASYTKEPWDPH